MKNRASPAHQEKSDSVWECDFAMSKRRKGKSLDSQQLRVYISDKHTAVTLIVYFAALCLTVDSVITNTRAPCLKNTSSKQVLKQLGAAGSWYFKQAILHQGCAEIFGGRCSKQENGTATQKSCFSPNLWHIGYVEQKAQVQRVPEVPPLPPDVFSQHSPHAADNYDGVQPAD